MQTLALCTGSTADLITSALELTLTFGITAYDAKYAALAQQTGLPMITADSTLIYSLQESGVETLKLITL